MTAATDLYTTEFFTDQDKKTWASGALIVPHVLRLLNPDRVIDVGCGTGVWLSAFRNAGVGTIAGVDGPWVKPEQLHIPRESFTVINLAAEWSVGGEFDLAACLEVAEHLPEKAAAPLISKLTSLAPAVLFSAALPGQGGTGHINEQWPGYWAKLFAQHGYQQLDCLRRHIWQDMRVAWYYQQNLFLYVHQRLIDANPVLKEEYERTKACPLTLVQADLPARATSFGWALRSLPRLAVTAIRRRLRRQA